MLRASAEASGVDVDITAVVDSTRDPGVPAGRALLAFADALVLDDPDELAVARRGLLDAVGETGTAKAAAVVGNFEMMNRCLDAIGARVAGFDELAAELGITVPPHLRPS